MYNYSVNNRLLSDINDRPMYIRSMHIDNGKYHKDYCQLANICLKQPLYSTSFDLLVHNVNIRVIFNENGINYSHTQSMVRNDFLQFLATLPLVSQNDRHHKEPMF